MATRDTKGGERARLLEEASADDRHYLDETDVNDDSEEDESSSSTFAVETPVSSRASSSSAFGDDDDDDETTTTTTTTALFKLSTKWWEKARRTMTSNASTMRVMCTVLFISGAVLVGASYGSGSGAFVRESASERGPRSGSLDDTPRWK